MTDIVERLRALSSQGDPTIENEAADRIVLLEGQLAVAADEIEWLRGLPNALIPTLNAEIERQRATLREQERELALQGLKLERLWDALDHKQWAVITEAIERYSDGRQPSDLVTLGLVSQGVLILDKARRAALGEAKDE